MEFVDVLYTLLLDENYCGFGCGNRGPELLILLISGLISAICHFDARATMVGNRGGFDTPETNTKFSRVCFACEDAKKSIVRTPKKQR